MKFSNLSRVHTTCRIEKNQTLTLSDNIFYYCKSVLRMKISEEFRLFNEIDGEFLVKVIEIHKRDLKIIIVDKLRDIEPLKPLILAICIIKPDRFVEAVKSAVQIGVTEIIPVISEYTQFKNINYERINKCIIEAAEQSERLILPILYQSTSLEQLCNMIHIEQIIFANEDEKPDIKMNSIKEFKNNIAVLIGPEGGFTKSEKEKLMANPKIISISLGNTVLKSEVASVAMLSCVNLMKI